MSTDLTIDAAIEGSLSRKETLIDETDRMGFDSIWTHEASHDPFLPLPSVASQSTDLQLGTYIATAFTRSPMVLAYLGWDLAEYSDGRFILGLGTQVQSHNERRFSVDWTAPTPRLAEVIESIRHIWSVWQGERDELDYQGDHYSFSLMTDFFDPGPIDHPDIPIYVAGVGEANTKLAGQLADGICLHDFNTPSYTEEVILPRIEAGADAGDRSIDDVEVVAIPFTITGATDDELEANRKRIRQQIAFYASTPSYHDVLAHHGWEDVGNELHDLSREGRWDEMPELITDEILYTFAVEGRPEEIAAEIEAQYSALADRVIFSMNYEGQDYWKRIVNDFEE